MAERKVHIQIVVSSREAQAALEGLAGSAEGLGGAFRVHTTEVRDGLRGVSREAAETARQVDQLDLFEGLGDGAREELDEVVDALDRAADAAEEAAGKTRGFGASFRDVARELKSAGTSLRAGDLGGVASSLGKVAAVAGPWLAAAGGIKVALEHTVGPAIAFEEAMMGVAKTTGLAGAELEALGRDLLDLSADLGVSKEEMAAIAETAGQLGISGSADLLAFSETVAKMAAVTDLSAEQAASAVAKIANAFQLPISEAQSLGSVLNELSNTTTATVGDLTQALGNIGSAGAQIGLAADEVAALGATLIDTGIDAATAGTSLRNVFIRLQTESDRLAEVAGVSGEAFRQMITEEPLAALDAYLAGLRQVPEHLRAIRIKEVFGDQQFLAVSTLAAQTELLSRNMATSAEAFREGESLNREFAATLDAVATQWRILTGHLEVFAVKVGSLALGPLSALLRGVNSLFGATRDLAGEVETLRDEMGQTRELEALVARYETLRENTARTAEEQAELDRILARLAERFPGMVTGYTDAGAAVDLYTDALRRAVEEQRSLLRLQMRERLEEIGDEVSGALEDIARKSGGLAFFDTSIEQMQARINAALEAGDERLAASIQENLRRLSENRLQQVEGIEALRDQLRRSAREVERLFGEGVSGNELAEELGITTEEGARLRLVLNEILATRQELAAAPGGPATPDSPPAAAGAGEQEAQEEREERIRRYQQAAEDAELRVTQVAEDRVIATLAGYERERAAAEARYRRAVDAAETAYRREVEAAQAAGLGKDELDARLEAAAAQRRAAQAQAEAQRESEQRRIGLEEQEAYWAEQEAMYARHVEQHRILGDAMEERERRAHEERMRRWEELGAMGLQVIGMISQTQQWASDEAIAALQQERDEALKALDTRQRAEVKRLQDQLKRDNLSAAQKEAIENQLAALQDTHRVQREKAEEEVGRRIADEKRRAFVAAKRAALLEIAINTAVAVSKVWGQTGIFGLAAQWPVLAMGAAQGAIVASQPVPQFAQGGLVPVRLSNGEYVVMPDEARAALPVWQTINTSGVVRGPGTGTSDSIPALVPPGAFVIRESAVSSTGAATIDRAVRAVERQMTLPRFAAGGSVGGGGAGVDDRRIVAAITRLEGTLIEQLKDHADRLAEIERTVALPLDALDERQQVYRTEARRVRRAAQ